jgi:hypothetical protein
MYAFCRIMRVWTYRRLGIDPHEDNGQLLSEVVDPGLSMSTGIADQEVRLPFAEVCPIIWSNIICVTVKAIVLLEFIQFVILSIQARRTLTSPGQNGQL